MGVKSTVRLTREQAVQRAADLRQKAQRLAVEASFYAMSNKELEDRLEILNDEAHDGEGFENYLIRDND